MKISDVIEALSEVDEAIPTLIFKDVEVSFCTPNGIPALDIFIDDASLEWQTRKIQWEEEQWTSTTKIEEGNFTSPADIEKLKEMLK